jgi:hypothetical protein
MTKDAPDETESSLSDPVASTSSPGSVFIFNCSPLKLTALNANGINVAPQGIAGIGAPGSSPNCVAVLLTVFQSPTLIAATFEGYTRPSWSEQIYELSTVNMYLWCYRNGFILADQNGIINYMFGQSTMSIEELNGDTDDLHEPARIISIAL